MPKPKWNLNIVYISERLQESLRPISRCAMTTVVAPSFESYISQRVLQCQSDSSRNNQLLSLIHIYLRIRKRSFME